jgi:cytochrome c biogenesis protein CcmG/thiol:disulfide interchange protein DsbE
MKKIHLSLFISLFLLCIAIGAARPDTSKALDFELQNLEGERVSLSSCLGKGPIILDFWATWCKPCVEELKHIQDIYEAYGGKGLQVLAISQDSPRSVAKVKSFIKGRRFTFTVLLDTNKEIYRKFRLYGLPHTFVLDKKGEIVFRRYGYRPGDEVELKETIKELMESERAATADSTQTDEPPQDEE